MKMFGSILSPKKSGSQEDNQASVFGFPHLFFGRRGREDTCILLPWGGSNVGVQALLYPFHRKVQLYKCKT